MREKARTGHPEMIRTDVPGLSFPALAHDDKGSKKHGKKGDNNHRGSQPEPQVG